MTAAVAATLAASAGTPGWPPPSCRSTRRAASRPGSSPPTATRGSSPPRPATSTRVIAGRLRHEALGPADLPAVGDWVAVGHGGSAIDAESDAMHAEHANGSGPTVIQAVLPRRTAFGRSTADSGRRTGSRAPTSRCSPPTSTSRWS